MSIKRTVLCDGCKKDVYEVGPLDDIVISAAPCDGGILLYDSIWDGTIHFCPSCFNKMRARYDQELARASQNQETK